jgi:hypothetical protein
MTTTPRTSARGDSELTDISIPVLLLDGRHDKFVPFGHGQWVVATSPAPKPGSSTTTAN